MEVSQARANAAGAAGEPMVKRKKKLDGNFYGIGSWRDPCVELLTPVRTVCQAVDWLLVVPWTAHIQATFNNTIVNITDLAGDTLAW